MKAREPQRAAAGDGEVELAITNIEQLGDGTSRVSGNLKITKPITICSWRLARCETCEGKGWVIDDDLPGVRLICRICEGERDVVIQEGLGS